jgi:hypothetical protein
MRLFLTKAVKAKGGFAPMTITKQQIFDIVKEFPDEVDVDELIYRLYLRQKLEASEEDVRNGRLIPHEEVLKETSKWSK